LVHEHAVVVGYCSGRQRDRRHRTHRWPPRDDRYDAVAERGENGRLRNTWPRTSARRRRPPALWDRRVRSIARDDHADRRPMPGSAICSPASLRGSGPVRRVVRAGRPRPWSPPGCRAVPDSPLPPPSTRGAVRPYRRAASRGAFAPVSAALSAAGANDIAIMQNRPRGTDGPVTGRRRPGGVSAAVISPTPRW